MKPTIYLFQEFPKFLPDPIGPVIVENTQEERRIRWERARHIGRVRANAIQAARADAFAADMVPVIVAIQAEGTTSLRGIANALNRRGIASPRGGRWQASRLQRLLRRVERAVSVSGLPQESVATG